MKICALCSVSLEIGSMYQIALEAMGPRLGVEIKNTIDFHKMGIITFDTVGQVVYQSLELCALTLYIPREVYRWK